MSPVLQSALALLASRKTLATLAAVAAATVLCVMGKIPVGDVVTLTGALTGVLVGSIAVEDGAMKRNEALPPPPPEVH